MGSENSKPAEELPEKFDVPDDEAKPLFKAGKVGLGHTVLVELREYTLDRYVLMASHG